MATGRAPQRSPAQRQFERGVGLHGDADLAETIEAYALAIQLDPEHTAALYGLGSLLTKAGRSDEAALVWKRALAGQHRSADDLRVMAELLLNASQAEEALVLLSAACRHHPGDYRLMTLNGRAMAAIGQSGPAIGALFMALDGRPDDPAIHAALANALHAVGDMDLAIHHCQLAYQLAPTRAYPGITIEQLIRRGEYEDALGLIDGVIRLRPHFLDALRDRAIALRGLGRFEDGLVAGHQAVAVAPGDVKARHNLAIARLALGLLTPETWDLFEWRLQRANYLPLWLAAAPRWNGENMAGQTLLLHAEQGLGDTLQFVRYTALVAGCAGRIILAVQPSLLRLMRDVPGVDEVIATNSPIPAFDRVCLLLSLPRMFGTTLATIPPAIAYVAEFARWDGPDCGLRVGLVWAGNRGFGQDHQRSLTAADLAPLAGIAGLQFYSLQLHEAEPMRSQLGLDMIDLMAGVDDFADTAARVAGLDLVVTVDTAVAHLAATMGKPVWLLSRHTGCWRWLYHRADSPWYPTLRVMRQTRPNDWSETIAQVRRDLTVMASDSLRLLDDRAKNPNQTRSLV